MAENEMVGWHYHLHVQEFEQTPGDGEGQGSWCASVHGVAKSQTQQRLNDDCYYSAKPGGTSDLALRSFSLSHIFRLSCQTVRVQGRFSCPSPPRGLKGVLTDPHRTLFIPAC